MFTEIILYEMQYYMEHEEDLLRKIYTVFWPTFLSNVTFWPSFRFRGSRTSRCPYLWANRGPRVRLVRDAIGEQKLA